MAEDYNAWLAELSKKTGASVEQSDLERLKNTNPDDVGRLKEAYESQYGVRGNTGQTGSGPDSSERTAEGYGSGRSENADDTGKYTNPDGSTSGGANSGMGSWAGAGGGSGSSSYSSGIGAMPDWYKDMMERNEARANEEYERNRGRGDALYGTLMDRSKQSLAIDRNDPIIRAQADAYSANQIRSQRDYLSDTAERSGGLANMQGERRMANERTGQATGEFEAQLMGRELTARRDEIQNAITQMGGMLSGEQMQQLQRELFQMDQAIKEAGVNIQGRGLDLTARGQDMGLQTAMMGNQLGWGQLGLQSNIYNNAWNDPLRKSVIT